MNSCIKVMALIASISLLLISSVSFAARPFNTKGTDGASALIPPISDCVYDIALVANTAQTVTWPTACGTPASGSNYAVFSSIAPYWVGAAGRTAQVPTVAVTNGTGSMLSPGQLFRYGDTSFSIISETTQIISISFGG